MNTTSLCKMVQGEVNQNLGNNNCPKTEKEKQLDKSSQCTVVDDKPKCREQRSCKEFKTSLFFKLSVANVLIGVLSIGVGVAIFIEGVKLTFWVTKIGFGILYGCLVLLTGCSGVFYSLSKSSAKAYIHVALNNLTFVCTLISFGFNGAAAVYYHEARQNDFSERCINATLALQNQANDSKECPNELRKTALAMAASYGIFLLINVAEIIISTILMVCSSKSRKCCRMIFSTYEDTDHHLQYSLPPGIEYGQAMCYSPQVKYHLDPTPLQPNVCKKQYSKPNCQQVAKIYTPCKKALKKQDSRRLPQFHAMESITESVESAETDCGSLPKENGLHDGMML